MTWIRERHGYDIVQLMLDTNVMSQGSGDSYVLKFALESEGYIAGGFARMLYRHLEGLEGKDNSDHSRLRDALYKYLKLHVPIEQTISSNSPKPKHRGDIDIWFPDEISAKDFWRRLNSCAGQSGYGIKREKSIAGFATNITVNNRLIFQIVTHVFGPPEEVMSGFDISNCRIAITKEGYVYDELFPELEKQKVLNVAAWTSLHTIPRFIKYLNHRGLASITDETSRGFVEYSVKALEDLQKNPDVDVTGLEVRPTLWGGHHHPPPTTSLHSGSLSAQLEACPLGQSPKLTTPGSTNTSGGSYSYSTRYNFCTPGTTRMSEDPRYGVVDRNCKVHVTERDILSILKQMKPYITNDSIMFLLALGFDNKLGYESLTKYLKRRAGIP